jgi:ribose 5-phosphate isomerase A
LPDALLYSTECLRTLFPHAKIVARLSDKNDGPAITGNGNYLLDVWFSSWPALQSLNALVKAITGIVDTSLFYNLAHKAIVAADDKIKIFEKPVLAV